ncbi:ABC transporter permease [Candidatus Moduliflexota bacterium]
MFPYVFRRLMMMVPLFLGITVVSFLVMHMAPGEPTDLVSHQRTKASPEAAERLRALYGLDQPLHVQYGRWLGRLVRLDFGRSFSPDRRPVFEKIAERMPVTVAVSLLSLLLSLAVALPVGIVSAVRRNSLFDRLSTVTVFLLFCIPGFWLAHLSQLLFGVYLGWLPISGLRSGIGVADPGFWAALGDYARHLVLPVVIGSLAWLAGWSRFMRSGMLEVVRQDYIRTARAKGLPEREVIGRHALRNAVLPIITILGLSVPGLIAGSVIFETIFGLPGVGQLMWQAVMARDYPVVMGNLVLTAVLTLGGNLLADIGYLLADPRISLGGTDRV